MTYYEVSDRTLRHYNQMLREKTSFNMRLKSADSVEGDIEVMVDEEGIAWQGGSRVGKASAIIDRIARGLSLPDEVMVGKAVPAYPANQAPTPQAPAPAPKPPSAPQAPTVLTPAVRIKGVSYGYNPATKCYERVDG